MTSTFQRLRALCILLAVALLAVMPARAQTPTPGTRLQCTAPTAGNPGNACAGNPINLITGNKYQRETDLAALPGVLGLEIVRHYNSVFGVPEVPNGLVGRGWRLSYEVELVAIGNTLQLIEADGHRIIFNRDPLHRSHCSSGDPANGTIDIVRTVRGEEYTWQRIDGQVWRFSHLRKLEHIVAPTGEFVSLLYDSAGLLMQVTDPQGRQLHLNYPDKKTARSHASFNGVRSIDSPAGRFDYHYGSAMPVGTSIAPSALLANLVRVRLPSHVERQYHYEDLKHPTLLTGISVSDAAAASAQRISTFGYQADGKAILSTHADGVDKVTLSYQPGGVTILTNSLGQITTYRHADIARENRLLEARGPGCALCSPSNIRYGYDARGSFLVEVVAPGNQVTRVTERDPSGRPQKIVTAAGITLNFDYDLAGHFTRVTSAGISEFLSYNALGQLSGMVLSSGQRLAMRYGADGRMTELSDVQGNRIRLQCDTEGMLLARTLLNPDGSIAQKANPSLFDIEADSNAGVQRGDVMPEVILAANNIVTRFQFAQDNRLARITDARNHQTGLIHDDFGRLVRVDSPDGGMTMFAFRSTRKSVKSRWET